MTATAAPAADAPVVTTGTLVARRPVGAYHLLTLAAPAVVAAARPGQFVSLEVGARGTLLRRPFAIAGVDPAAGVLDVVVAVVGRGSAWLAEQPVSTTVALTGPLGRGFTAPTGTSRCLLVGGGYGVAALVWLAGQLVAAGHAVELLSGARTADALYPVPRGPLADVTLHEATEDGSRGHEGLITSALGERLDAGAAEVFACGPMPMLAAVADLAAHHGAGCHVAVEEHMGCSIGVCMTCVVPTDRGYARACIDGPVMDAATIDWARVGEGGR